MSNRIDGTDGPGGMDPTARAAEMASPEGASFEDALAKAEQIESIDPAGDEQKIHEAIAEISSKVEAGELVDPTEITAEVVDRIVAIRFAHMDDGSGVMAAEIRQTLLNDPYFVMEVESLIARALEGDSG